MGPDGSCTLHIRWMDFANDLLSEFGSTPDEADVHFAIVNNSRHPKELIKDYCFRMSALGT